MTKIFFLNFDAQLGQTQTNVRPTTDAEFEYRKSGKKCDFTLYSLIYSVFAHDKKNGRGQVCPPQILSHRLGDGVLSFGDDR